MMTAVAPRVPRLAIRSLLLAALLQQLLAQGGRWSAEFDHPGLGLLGTPHTLCTWRGELVAGTRKSFASDGQATRINYVGHYDGLRWQPFGTGVDGIVYAALSFNDDLYVAGAFRNAGGRPAANIARWDGSTWHAVGDGFDGEVRALAVYQNRLHAAGLFGRSGTRVVERVARLDGNGWTQVGGGINRQTFQPEVLCLLSAGGRLYAGGSFDRAGTAAANHIAAWDGTAWTPLGAGINPTRPHAIVASLASFGNKVVAGGSFVSAGTVAARNIAAWNGRGWEAMGPGLTNATYLAIVESLMEYQGALYAGGSFIWIDEDTSPTAIPVARFAKWDGARWSSVGGVTEGLFLPNVIFAMTIHDGRLFVGGDFTVAGPDPLPASGFVSRFVASFDGKDWGAAGRGLGLDRPARRLIPWKGGVVAVGGFTQAGSAPARAVSFFDGATWRTLGTFDRDATDAVVFGNDLIVAGNFYRVDGQVLGGVVRFDGKSWSSMGHTRPARSLAVYRGELHAGGTGAPVRLSGPTWQTFGTPLFGVINDMHVFNGQLFIGGSFSLGSGRPNLVTWDGTTMVPVAGSGTDDRVEVLADDGVQLAVGGAFTRVGSTTANRVALFDGRGWRQPDRGVQGAGTVLALAWRAGSLYVGGNFTTFGGNPDPWLLRYDGNALLPVPGGVDGTVHALLSDPGLDRLYVSGELHVAGGLPAAHLSALEFRPQFADVGNGLAGTGRTPHLEATGLLVANGDVRLDLSSARERAPALLVFGVRRVDAPFLGGVLVPSPDVTLPLLTDGIGRAGLGARLPAGLGAGVTLHTQAWVADGGAPFGASASNGLALRSH